MRRRIATALAPLLLAAMLIASSSCGAAAADDDAPDAATTSQCTMVIGVSPSAPESPATLYLDGSIIREGNLSGVEAFQFAVTFDGTPVTLTDLDPFDGSKMSFDAPAHGVYRVTLSGSVGSTDCADGLENVNVIEPTANLETYRVRFVPAMGQPAPVQERLYAIPGGGAYSLGTIGLESGVEAIGHVRDVSASPLAAYLRVTLSESEARAVETFADASGAYSARLGAGSYDVLIVPESGAVAPGLFTGLAVSSLDLLTLTEGDALIGSVLDPAGAPLEGAQVSLRVGGVPSTIATTNASGAFVLLARAGGATALTVNPPEGSGLPRLDLPADAGLVAAGSAPLTIRHASALTERTVALSVVRSDGSTPAPGARVTFIARAIASAGTITPSGSPALDAAGGLRVTAEADAGGALPSLALPEAVYDVIVEPPATLAGEAVRLTDVDLSAGVGAPATLSLAQTATLTGQVVDSARAPLAGVSVTAVPRGLLANIAGASARATTSAEGAYALAVVGKGEYDLVLEPISPAHGRARVSGAIAPLAGNSSALGETELPTAIAVSGRVEIPGVAGGAAGVHVMALCHECTGVMAEAPVAEVVTDVSGSFVLAIPDPGIGE